VNKHKSKLDPFAQQYRWKALAMMLLQKNATVTVCHSRTVDLPSFSRKADVLVATVLSYRGDPIEHFIHSP
jgi:Tetrahydrofolate dehydrogenase/cyclohydrolase, NAD(P)-binding domain